MLLYSHFALKVENVTARFSKMYADKPTTMLSPRNENKISHKVKI